MRLGIAYNLFDGEELLPDSLRTVRKSAEYIVVLYQMVSFRGTEHPEAPFILKLLNHLKVRGLIDEYVLFDPIKHHGAYASTSEDFKVLEVKKRNEGLRLAQDHGCTHFMSMDTDEFYVPAQFEHMKYALERTGVECGIVRHLQYYGDNMHVKRLREQEYVSTICKIAPHIKFQLNYPFPKSVDPTRRPTARTFRIFERFEVQMHHLSYVRLDIARKLSDHQHLTEAHTFRKIVEHHRMWSPGMNGVWAGGIDVELRRISPIVDLTEFTRLRSSKFPQ